MAKYKQCLTFACLFLMFVNCVFGGPRKNKRMQITNIQNCDIPPNKYDMDHYVNHTVTTLRNKGKTYSTANFTINKETPTIMFNIRAFEIRNNETKKAFELVNLTCRNELIAAFLRKIKLHYNSFNCSSPPGEYFVPRFTIDYFMRYYQYNYSSALVELELVNSKGVMICLSGTLESIVK